MKVFIQLKMVEMLDDETIYMTEVKKMTGTETAWAEKKRLYRDRFSEDTPRTLSASCPPDVRQEIEIDTIDKKSEFWKKWNENEVRKSMRISKLVDLSIANRDNQIEI